MGKKNKEELQQWNPGFFQVSRDCALECYNFPFPGFFVSQCSGLRRGKGFPGIPPHLCFMQGTNIWASSRAFLSKGGFGSSEGGRGEDKKVEESLGSASRWRQQLALAEPMARRNCSSVLGRKQGSHWRAPKKISLMFKFTTAGWSCSSDLTITRKANLWCQNLSCSHPKNNSPNVLPGKWRYFNVCG